MIINGFKFIVSIHAGTENNVFLKYNSMLIPIKFKQ